MDIAKEIQYFQADTSYIRTAATALKVQPLQHLSLPQVFQKKKKIIIIVHYLYIVCRFLLLLLFLSWNIICCTKGMSILIYCLIFVCHSTSMAPRLGRCSWCTRGKSLPERAVNTSHDLCVLGKQHACPCTWLLQVSIIIPALLYDIQICLHLLHVQAHPRFIATSQWADLQSPFKSAGKL